MFILQFQVRQAAGVPDLSGPLPADRVLGVGEVPAAGQGPGRSRHPQGRGRRQGQDQEGAQGRPGRAGLPPAGLVRRIEFDFFC